MRALVELVRVTALKGRVLVTAWAFEQTSESSKRQFESQDVQVPWVLPAEVSTSSVSPCAASVLFV